MEERMKGFALLVAALAGAALLYVTTAVGSQQAGPSRAEFSALKKQVAAIKVVLNTCFTSGLPAIQYDGYESRATDGSTFITTGLDVAGQGDTPQYYLLDVGQSCASTINSKLHGLRLAKPAATRR
jgi:hypothetical protein